jgi:bifunctional DNase/RNase
MDLLPCRLTHVLIEEQTDSQVIFLAELDGDRRLPIVIGPMEAAAINRAVKDEQFSRPLTHDLLAAVIEATGHSCREIRIVDLKEGTFFAELVLVGPDEREQVVDCRPSDAIALLVRLDDVPLTVAERVFAAHDA